MGYSLSTSLLRHINTPTTRHCGGTLLLLDTGGWASIIEIARYLQASVSTIMEVVAGSDKARFQVAMLTTTGGVQFSPVGVRASQGHSFTPAMATHAHTPPPSTPPASAPPPQSPPSASQNQSS